MSAAKLSVQLPSRSEFNSRQRRFVDVHGRVYVLPKRDDALFKSFVDKGEVDADNYERKLRRGLEFDAEKELKELTRSVLFYVELPKRQRYDTWSDMPRTLDPMSGGESTSVLPETHATSRQNFVLREVESGALYTGRVDFVQGVRSINRGLVIVRNLRLINRGQRAQAIPRDVLQ